jgi:hypothetical protein
MSGLKEKASTLFNNLKKRAANLLIKVPRFWYYTQASTVPSKDRIVLYVCLLGRKHELFTFTGKV